MGKEYKMNDKGYYYTKISAYEREIAACNIAISKKNQQASELASLKSKIFRYSEVFDEVQRNRRNSLSLAVGELFSRKRYSQRIVQSFEQGMNELLSGSEQKSVFDGLIVAEETVAEKIRRLNNEIEECYRQISEYNDSIAECRREIRRIEEREREYGRYRY